MPMATGPARLFNAHWTPLYERLTVGSMAAIQRARAMFSAPLARAMFEHGASKSGHDAGVDTDAAGVFGKGDVADVMAPVLDGPVVPDGVREGRSRQHHGRGVEGRFLASRPGPGRCGADQGAAGGRAPEP